MSRVAMMETGMTRVPNVEVIFELLIALSWSIVGYFLMYLYITSLSEGKIYV